jgi:hypothetical protein
MNVLDMIAARLGEPNVQALSQKLGTDRQQTLMAVAHSFPTLVGSLAKNAQQPEGAQSLASALDRDHNGSILANIGGHIANPAPANGAGILRHALGDNQPAVAQLVATKSGISGAAAGSILEIMAPLVMGLIGKRKQSEGLDAGGVAGILLSMIGGGQPAAAQAQAQAPDGGGFLSGITEKLGGLTNMANIGGLVNQAKGFIDKDKDGDIMDDLQGMLGGLFGGK